METIKNGYLSSFPDVTIEKLVSSTIGKDLKWTELPNSKQVVVTNGAQTITFLIDSKSKIYIGSYSVGSAKQDISIIRTALETTYRSLKSK